MEAVASPSRNCEACPPPKRELRADLWEPGVAQRPPPAPAAPPAAPAPSTAATAAATDGGGELAAAAAAVQAELGPPLPPPPPPKNTDTYTASEPGSGEPTVLVPPFEPPVPPVSSRGFYPEGASSISKYIKFKI